MAELKHRLLGTAIRLLKYTAAYRICRPFYSGMGIILALHRVVPQENQPRIKASSRIEITADFLMKLIEFFQGKGYEIISLDTLHARLTEKKQGHPFVCFTFDDGYVDAHEIIYPIFKKYQAPFAVYVVTSFAERKAVLWWYMLESLVLSHNSLEFTYRHQHHELDTSTHDKKEEAFSRIRNLFMDTPQETLTEEVETFFAPWTISAEDYAEQQMNWAQVIELSNDPLVTIGAHTIHHYNLRQLTAEQVRQEIEESKKILETKTGHPVHHFAYPFGSRTEAGAREFAIAAGCGFKTAVTIREGAVFPGHRDHLECLPRIEITGRYQDITLVDMRRCGAVSILRNGLKRIVTV